MAGGRRHPCRQDPTPFLGGVLAALPTVSDAVWLVKDDDCERLMDGILTCAPMRRVGWKFICKAARGGGGGRRDVNKVKSCARVASR